MKNVSRMLAVAILVWVGQVMVPQADAQQVLSIRPAPGSRSTESPRRTSFRPVGSEASSARPEPQRSTETRVTYRPLSSERTVTYAPVTERVVTYSPVVEVERPVVSYSPMVTTYRPSTTAYYSPMVTTYRPRRTAYYSPLVTAYSPPAYSPMVTAYSPVTGYSPLVTAYSPTAGAAYTPGVSALMPTVAPTGVWVNPKVYVAGQPIRNLLRAITP